MSKDLEYALDPVMWSVEILDYHPDSWAQMVMSSPSKYVIENVSRQAGKSTCSAAMAVHRAVFFPGSLILVVSPTLRQSGELQRKAMTFYDMVDPHHDGLAEDTKLSIQLTNGSRIIALPGHEDNLRGYSAPDLIIEDEASRVSDDLHVSLRALSAWRWRWQVHTTRTSVLLFSSLSWIAQNCSSANKPFLYT